MKIVSAYWYLPQLTSGCQRFILDVSKAFDGVWLDGLTYQAKCTKRPSTETYTKLSMKSL